MPHACVNAAAIRIQPANDHVIDPDQRRENAHRRDEPERRITGYGERETDDVRFTRPPIAVKNRRRARHIDVARSFYAGADQALAARIFDEPRPERQDGLIAEARWFRRSVV